MERIIENKDKQMESCKSLGSKGDYFDSKSGYKGRNVLCVGGEINYEVKFEWEDQLLGSY